MASEKIATLKLRAEDSEDLEVISACLQDSLVQTGGMHFDSREHVFQISTLRFCWEEKPEKYRRREFFQRVHSRIEFKNVSKVQHRGIDRSKPLQLLELLNVEAVNDNEIHLYFAGGGEIMLRVDSIKCLMCDKNDKHWTENCPRHEL